MFSLQYLAHFFSNHLHFSKFDLSRSLTRACSYFEIKLCGYVNLLLLHSVFFYIVIIPQSVTFFITLEKLAYCKIACHAYGYKLNDTIWM